MAITKENRFYKMEVLPDGRLQVATRETFVENDEVLGYGSISRKVIHPGDDVPAGSDEIVSNTASAVHTPARIAAHRAAEAARNANQP